MKSTFKKTSVALAVAALFISPIAFASDGGDGESHYIDLKVDAAAELNLNASATFDSTHVSLKKDITNTKDVAITGGAEVTGVINVDASSMAVVDDQQISYQNEVTNTESTNAASVNGNALNNAKGNIGVNVTSGDNNQQANAAAFSAADASFVFGASDAEIFARQHAEHNSTYNNGQTNTATLGGDALANASGNIGVNISAGNSNQQKNDLAASVAVARIGEASVHVIQQNDHNSTTNNPVRHEETQYHNVDLAFAATGRSAGIVDQNGNQYPDTWGGNITNGGSHPCCDATGHVDLDNEVQGASDRPVSSGLDSNGNPNGNLSNGGALSFNEQGDIALSGSVTGSIPVLVAVNLATTNTASLGDNALMNASGNIGVNIASGTNNQQYNGLAMSATQAGTTTGGGSSHE